MKDAQSPPRPLPIGLELGAGESVLKDEMVSVITGLLTTFSRLILTDQRLIFVPLSSPPAFVMYDLRLSEVARVAAGSFWARVRLGKFLGYPEAVVTLGDGETVRFRAISATAWVHAIEALLT